MFAPYARAHRQTLCWAYLRLNSQRRLYKYAQRAHNMRDDTCAYSSVKATQYASCVGVRHNNIWQRVRVFNMYVIVVCVCVCCISLWHLYAFFTFRICTTPSVVHTHKREVRHFSTFSNVWWSGRFTVHKLENSITLSRPTTRSYYKSCFRAHGMRYMLWGCPLIICNKWCCPIYIHLKSGQHRLNMLGQFFAYPCVSSALSNLNTFTERVYYTHIRASRRVVQLLI